MAFLKGAQGTIEVPLVAHIPALKEDGDEVEEITLEVKFIGKFTRFKRKEARKVMQKVMEFSAEAANAFKSGDMSSINDRLEYFDELLLEHVKGWRKMPGPDGEEVPFSEEALREAVEDPDYAEALLAGLRRALGWGDASSKGGKAKGQPGSAEEEAKNS